MRIRRSVTSRASALAAGALLTACIATPVAAQELTVAQENALVVPGLRVAVANAAATTSSPGADPQAPAEPAKPGDQAAPATPPAPTPAEVAAKQDAATLSFFRDIEFSGFVDTYYSYNANRPSKACGVAGTIPIYNCLYNFNVAHNSFTLSMAELSVNKTPTSDSRAGFRLDLDYGPTQAIVNSAEPGGAGVFQNIGQAYVSYLAPVGKGLQFDVGKFVTLFGQEVIKTKDDWNYSRGLLFSWAIPYYHEGFRATYNANDKVMLAGYVVNGWNNAVDNNAGKSVAGQVMVKPNAAWMLMENYMVGPEQAGDDKDIRQLSDTILSYTANAKVSLVANYDYGQDTCPLPTVSGTACTAGSRVKWQGIAGYLHYQPNAIFAFTPRVEYFDDQQGFQTGVAQKLSEITLTGEVKSKEGVILRIEYRGDFSNVPFFIQSSSPLVKYQNTLTVGVIYAFTTKAQ